MPETKPSGLPEKPADDVIFGPPVNDRPLIALPDPEPEDPARERVVSEGATHIVIANRFGEFARGDKISEDDLPEAADFEAIARIKPYPPIRPLNADERPKAHEVTKHRRPKVVDKLPIVPEKPPEKPPGK